MPVRKALSPRRWSAVINRKRFFDGVRHDPFSGRLRKAQVEGMSTILDEWERGHAAADRRWLAYMLATAFHETAFTMQPIREIGGPDYFFRMYDRKGERPSVASDLGNTKDGDGVRFHGRGFVQLTGRNNYHRMGKLLGVDLVGDPDRAMDTATATRIMFQGMIDGLFTSHKLADFFHDGAENWFEARRIINRLDRAADIERYARRFHVAVLEAERPVGLL
jgi:putative chitinase